MYSYYALKAMHYRVPRFVSMAITVAQLSQMVAGCAVNLWAYQVNNILLLLVYFFICQILCKPFSDMTSISCKTKNPLHDREISVPLWWSFVFSGIDDATVDSCFWPPSLSPYIHPCDKISERDRRSWKLSQTECLLSFFLLSLSIFEFWPFKPIVC